MAIFTTHKEATRYRWALVEKAQEAGDKDTTYALETWAVLSDATPLLCNLGVEEY